MKFSAVVLFVILWVTMVYFPIAHMAWDAAGLYFSWGTIDFAGGTVVHINAGIAALVGAMVIGPRIGYRKEIMAPHSMTLTMVGASILWVGWFGFNAGSALSAGGVAALAMINTFVATAGAVAGLGGDRGDAPRQGLDARRRLRRGGGARRGHPGGGLRRTGGRDRARRSSPRPSATSSCRW